MQEDVVRNLRPNQILLFPQVRFSEDLVQANCNLSLRPIIAAKSDKFSDLTALLSKLTPSVRFRAAGEFGTRWIVFQKTQPSPDNGFTASPSPRFNAAVFST